MNLTLDDHRIDDCTEIIDRYKIDDDGDACFGIDLDLANMATRGKGEIGRVIKCTFLETGFDLGGGKAVCCIGRKRDFRPCERLVCAFDREAAIGEIDIFDSGFHKVCRDFLGFGFNLVQRADDGAPVRTSTLPVGLTRTSADSHKPTPAPSEPTAADGAMPQASI